METGGHAPPKGLWSMMELLLRNFDKAVLEKLNLSAEAREAFRKLLAGRVIRKEKKSMNASALKNGDPLAECGLYNGA